LSAAWVAQLQGSAGNRAVSALLARRPTRPVLQRMQLTPQLRAQIPRMNSRQLRETFQQATEDRDRLTQQLTQLQDLEDLRTVQRDIVARLGPEGVASLTELNTVGPQILAQRAQLEQRRDALESALSQGIEQQLGTELAGAPVPSNEHEHTVRQQQIGQRRQELRAQANLPELGEVTQQLRQADELIARGELELARLEARLRETFVHFPPSRADAYNQRLTQIFAAVSAHNSFQVQTQIATLRQELGDTQAIGAAVQQRRDATPMLTFAEGVRAEVQGRLAVGAGNQLSDLRQTAGLSGELTDLVRSIRRLPRRNPIMSIAQEALIADTLHAGNCGEHASLAFTLLWRRLPGVQLTLYSHSMDHAFVVIGDRRDQDTAVVCDAWPRQGHAVLLRDFFVQHGLGRLSNIRVESNADGRDLMAVVRDTVDLETAQARMQEERAPLSQQEAQRRWGGQQGVYQHDFTHRQPSY
jgi:hypothetical protein